MGEPITETQVNITSFTMGPQWVLAGGRNDGEYLVNRETKERQAIDMYKLISILLIIQERNKRREEKRREEEEERIVCTTTIY